MNRLTDKTIEQRFPVWEALSRIWLDTELQDFDYQYIARVIREHRLSLESAKQIHFYEVAPAVRINALSVAGEWVAFDPDLLKDECSKNAAKRDGLWHRINCKLWGRFHRSLVDECWQEIEKHYNEWSATDKLANTEFD